MKTIVVIGEGVSEPEVVDLIKEKITTSNNKYKPPSAQSCPDCGSADIFKPLQEGGGYVCWDCDCEWA